MPGRRVPTLDRGRTADTPRVIVVVDERRFPLNGNKFQIGLAAVVMLVFLRVAIGWHFLYEGVWKIVHSEKFSAEPFLSQAKGPAAPLFYAMLPDLDGRQRLALTTNEAGQKTINADAYLQAWKRLKTQVIDGYKPGPEQAEKIDAAYQRYEDSLEDYLAANQEDIVAYHESLARFEAEQAAGNNGAPFQKQRAWDRQMELRREVNAWLTELDGMGEEYRLALWDVLDQDQKSKGMLPKLVASPEELPVRVPFVQTRSDALDLSVTYGLTAIGFCLVLGLCTRLAALGGGVFLLFVLLTQPPWPTIYPPAPEVVGHALIVDKNFVEMIAILALAALPVGRWGGLDYFLYHWIGRPLKGYFDKKI
ncbi:MAG: hypothetical protein HUU20_22660 [Pirellulales bacterium]|nr:hypothetical protein [Pirellulales bacterium]